MLYISEYDYLIWMRNPEYKMVEFGFGIWIVEQSWWILMENPFRKLWDKLRNLYTRGCIWCIGSKFICLCDGMTWSGDEIKVYKPWISVNGVMQWGRRAAQEGSIDRSGAIDRSIVPRTWQFGQFVFKEDFI